jgi:SNF2 family DNA or RNA helicase
MLAAHPPALPPPSPARLYGFQREGVRRAVQLGGRCLLADEMGLGKTVQVCVGV